MSIQRDHVELWIGRLVAAWLGLALVALGSAVVVRIVWWILP